MKKKNWSHNRVPYRVYAALWNLFGWPYIYYFLQADSQWIELQNEKNKTHTYNHRSTVNVIASNMTAEKRAAFIMKEMCQEKKKKWCSDASSSGHWSPIKIQHIELQRIA